MIDYNMVFNVDERAFEYTEDGELITDGVDYDKIIEDIFMNVAPETIEFNSSVEIPVTELKCSTASSTKDKIQAYFTKDTIIITKDLYVEDSLNSNICQKVD